MAEAVRVLRPGGRAVLLSPDADAVGRAARSFHWSPSWRSSSVNLGGLSAKLAVMERRDSCYKDATAWVREDGGDMSEVLMTIANEACSKYSIDEYHLLQKSSSTDSRRFQKNNLVDRVELQNTYFNKETDMLSHCYRFVFDDRLTNYQAKLLEKCVRAAVVENRPAGLVELR